MTRINLKKMVFYPVHYRLIHEYDLNPRQALIFAYLFNHCQGLNNDGYCGYSNERMAKEINIPKDTFKRELSLLRDKGLIVIENPRKFTKKANESRMIYINTSVFLEEEQTTLTDIELDNAKKEIERLKEQVDNLSKELQMAKRNYANAYTSKIAYSGVVPEDQLDDMHRMLAPVYEAMANEYTFKQIMSHIDYVINQIKRRDVSKPIAYILNSAQHFKPNKQKEEEIDKTFHSLPKGVDLNKLENDQEFYHQEVLDLDDDDPFA